LKTLKRQAREFEWAALNPDKSKTGDAAKWAAQLRPDGSWADVDYTDKVPNFWKTSAHLARTQAMAARYAEEKAASVRDDALKAATLSATRYWIRHDFRNPNWWHNEIAVPQYMATILLLMEDEASAEDRAGGLKIAARATISLTGQNRVWKAGIVFRRALVEGDMDLARRARAAILEELAIAPPRPLGANRRSHADGRGIASRSKFSPARPAAAIRQLRPRLCSRHDGVGMEMARHGVGDAGG
jgi:chondroitin AC lyase